jgi:hypothetical protein
VIGVCTSKKAKGVFKLITCHEGPEGEYRYSSTLSLTSALDGSGWTTPHPGRFTSEKETRDLFYSWLGGPKDRSGRVGRISPPPGFNPRTVKPVASHYTDWAIPVDVYINTSLFINDQKILPPPPPRCIYYSTQLQPFGLLMEAGGDRVPLTQLLCVYVFIYTETGTHEVCSFVWISES